MIKSFDYYLDFKDKTSSTCICCLSHKIHFSLTFCFGLLWPCSNYYLVNTYVHFMSCFEKKIYSHVIGPSISLPRDVLLKENIVTLSFIIGHSVNHIISGDYYEVIDNARVPIIA